MRIRTILLSFTVDRRSQRTKTRLQAIDIRNHCSVDAFEVPGRSARRELFQDLPEGILWADKVALHINNSPYATGVKEV